MSIGLTFGLAGRFRAELVRTIAGHVMETDAGKACTRWRMAWCYGTLLQSADGGTNRRGRFDLRGLEEIKTDMALLRFEPDVPGRARQPLVRRDRTGPWAFCHDGAVRRPDLLDPGNRVADSADPSERLFLHVLGRFDREDPAESLRAIHEALPAEPEQSLVLMNPDVLVASCWRQEPEGGAAGPELWLGHSKLLRLLAPFRLEGLEQATWSQMPNRNIVALTRLRHELD